MIRVFGCLIEVGPEIADWPLMALLGLLRIVCFRLGESAACCRLVETRCSVGGSLEDGDRFMLPLAPLTLLTLSTDTSVELRGMMKPYLSTSPF